MNSQNTTVKKQSTFTNFKHTWIVMSIAILLAITMIVILPANKTYSMIFAGVAAGHFVMALLVLFTGWIVFPQRLFEKIFGKRKVAGFDFGWSPKWLFSFAFGSLLVFVLALYVYISFNGSPVLQLLFYSLLLLLAINLFIGYLVMSSSKRQARLTLPMVTLLPDGKGNILDAGCGAGRTTIALAQAIPGAYITAFDKFNASYIDGGGMGLLQKNAVAAGISQRVSMETGDITATSFLTNTFDAIVSSYMFDHLGPHKKKALSESYRILKPGGRFLLIIAIRSVSTFAIGNVLSLLFPSRNKWKRWIEEAGFTMICDGKINEGAYFCFEKPVQTN